MKTDHLPLKEEGKEAKRAQKRLDRASHPAQFRADTTKLLKMKVSIKAGRVRGGHAFH